MVQLGGDTLATLHTPPPPPPVAVVVWGDRWSVCRPFRSPNIQLRFSSRFEIQLKARKAPWPREAQSV